MHLVISNIYHIQVPWENYVPSTYDYGKWLKIRFFLDSAHERMEKCSSQTFTILFSP